MLDHNLRRAGKAQWVPLPAPETRVMLPASPGGTNRAVNEPSASEADSRCCRKPFLTSLPGTYSCWHHTEQAPQSLRLAEPYTHCRCRSPKLWVQKLHRMQELHSCTLCMQEPGWLTTVGTPACCALLLWAQQPCLAPQHGCRSSHLPCSTGDTRKGAHGDTLACCCQRGDPRPPPDLEGGKEEV